MNCEAEKLVDARREEQERLGGLPAYRLQALRNLRLKTVIKESHASPVHALAVNHADPALGSLFATVGKDQATVYDDEHMGDHVAVVAHFTNAPSEHAPGGELAAAAWLGAGAAAGQPSGDACLAVAGGDPNISVISVAEARVVRLLRGHTREVADLAAAGGAAPRLLASLSRDGDVRLWDVPSEACLASIQHPDATCIAMAPDGGGLLVGTSRGKLYMYYIAPAAAAGPAAGLCASAQQQQQEQQQQQQEQQQQQQQHGATPPAPRIDAASRREIACVGGCHTEAIDCVRFLPGSRLATKSSDGRMFVWQLSSCADTDGAAGSTAGTTQAEATTTWKVPSCSGGSGWSNRCQFGSTRDGRYIAAGNSKGDCYVFDSETGERAGYVAAVRVSAPVRACGLSEDCRHLLAVLGKGFIFRFEYHGALAAPAASEEGGGGGGGEEGKENMNVGQHEGAGGSAAAPRAVP